MADEDLTADEEEEGGGGEWMATFADLMSLLMTFFVLLLSFATMDITKFRMALGSVKDAFGVEYHHPGNIEAVSTSIIQFSKEESSRQIQTVKFDLLRVVKQKIKEAGLAQVIEAEMGARGVVVRVKGQVLYGSGSADLRDDGARRTLDAVVEIAKLLGHPLTVEGHTDDRPISTRKYPSNWELSTARARSAMDYLAQNGVPLKTMGIAGYAHMKPLVPNDTEENRARNRRVEFVFVRDSAKPVKELEQRLEKDERIRAITREEEEAARAELERLRADDEARREMEQARLAREAADGTPPGDQAAATGESVPADGAPEADGKSPAPDAANSAAPSAVPAASTTP